LFNAVAVAYVEEAYVNEGYVAAAVVVERYPASVDDNVEVET
jgi:hypothetical protein